MQSYIVIDIRFMESPCMECVHSVYSQIIVNMLTFDRSLIV